MFGRHRNKTASNVSVLDGGEGRGVPLGGQDEHPPRGYRADEDLDDQFETEDAEMFWEDGDPADRRKDPLRKP